MDNSPRFEGIPELIYGTAFKFDNTASLVEIAIKSGFRALDTAANRPQYRESQVGEGIAAAIASGVVKRHELYIQTKFSPLKPNRDPANYSYDTTAPIPAQVAQSVSSSLTSLGVSYIDCLVLHSLYSDIQDTLTAWRAMEALVPATVSSLGLSNVDVDSLRLVYEAARVKPRSVQNRFTADTAPRPEAELPEGLPYPRVKYDRDVRAYCGEKGVTYAPWGVLWGNPEVMEGEGGRVLDEMARGVGVSKQVVIYGCMRGLGGCGVSILCGTTKEERMREVVMGLGRLERWIQESEECGKVWRGCVDYIKSLVDSE